MSHYYFTKNKYFFPQNPKGETERCSTACRVDPLRLTTRPHLPGSTKNGQEDVLLAARQSESRPREPARLVSLPAVTVLATCGIRPPDLAFENT
jgi:hypothetical protein